MEIHRAFQEKFSPDVLVEKTQPLPVYYGNVCLRHAEQLAFYKQPVRFFKIENSESH